MGYFHQLLRRLHVVAGDKFLIAEIQFSVCDDRVNPDRAFRVPGRSLRLDVEITNQSESPMRLGEFTTANLRFLDKSLDVAVAGVDPSFPKDLVAGSSLKLSDSSPIAPGEKRTLRIEATDAAWEIERLVSFLTNVDSRVGGMLFFFDAKGQRHMAEVFGPIVPVFTQLQLAQSH